MIGLVFSEYLLSGLVPSVKEVNDEEPLFPVAILNRKAAYEVSLLSLVLVSQDNFPHIYANLRTGN